MVRRPPEVKTVGPPLRDEVGARAPKGAPHLEPCPLCGTEFDPAGQGCRPSCPLSAGCSVVCCPSCGYSFPQETGLAGRLRAFLQRRRTRP